MNLPEFKAWFEGFTENISGVPSVKQWKRICSRVKQIKGEEPTTERVFIDRYIRPYYPQPYWSYPWGNYCVSNSSVSNVSKGSVTVSYQGLENNDSGNYMKWSTTSNITAFNQLGKTDAQLMS